MQQVQRDLYARVTVQVLEPVGRTRARCDTTGMRFPNGALAVACAPMRLVDPFVG